MIKKTFFFVILISAGLLFLPSCFFEGGLSHDVIGSVSDEQERRRRDDLGGLCREDEGCEEICEEVYDDSGDEENDGKIEACMDLNYSVAIQFEDIIVFLEEPYESNLKDINHRTFFEFLDISLEPWVRSTREASSSEAEALLIWVAREQRISTAIVDAYQNYEREYDKFEGVANLFKEIEDIDLSGCVDEDLRCAEIFNAITKVAIVGRQISFWNIVQDTLSASATNIACEIFVQRCSGIYSLSVCDVDTSSYNHLAVACGGL